MCIHCKKCGVLECPRGAIFSCFHGNPYCYHGNRKILLPSWTIQLHHIFYMCTLESNHNRATEAFYWQMLLYLQMLLHLGCQKKLIQVTIIVNTIRSSMRASISAVFVCEKFSLPLVKMSHISFQIWSVFTERVIDGPPLNISHRSSPM